MCEFPRCADFCLPALRFFVGAQAKLGEPSQKFGEPFPASAAHIFRPGTIVAIATRLRFHRNALLTVDHWFDVIVGPANLVRSFPAGATLVPLVCQRRSLTLPWRPFLAMQSKFASEELAQRHERPKEEDAGPGNGKRPRTHEQSRDAIYLILDNFTR